MAKRTKKYIRIRCTINTGKNIRQFKSNAFQFDNLKYLTVTGQYICCWLSISHLNAVYNMLIVWSMVYVKHVSRNGNRCQPISFLYVVNDAHVYIFIEIYIYLLWCLHWMVLGVNLSQPCSDS